MSSNQQRARLSQQSVDVAKNGDRFAGVVSVQRPRHEDTEKLAEGKLAVTIQDGVGHTMTGVIDTPSWLVIDDE